MFYKKQTARVILIILALLILAPGGIWALNVKLGSPFPEGSEWDNTLKRLAAEWMDITGGQVRLRIYPGGVAGDDGDMVRKMRFNQLDAAVLTTFGMKSIVPNSFVMTLPGMLQSEEELDSVLRDFAPRFDQDFVDEGFRVMAWSKTGWAYLFSRNRSPDPGVFKQDKLAVSSSDQELVVAFKAMDFNVVPTSISEQMVSLQSGMTDSFYAPPMVAAVFQWFGIAPYMINLPVSPVVGGLVLSERTWNRIPERYHAELRASVDEVIEDFYIESVRMNEESLNIMSQNGMEIIELNDRIRQKWYDELAVGVEIVIGDDSWIDQDVFDAYVSHLNKIR